MIIFLIEKAKKFVLIITNRINWKMETWLIGPKFKFKDLLASLILICSFMQYLDFSAVLVSTFSKNIKRSTWFIRLAKRNSTKKLTF